MSNKTPQQVAEQLVETFNRIHIENMQGIPILNPNIGIEAVGFQEIEGRILGIIICPWLMNVVLLPNEAEDWTGMDLGHKQPHEFSNRIYKFMINEYDGIGVCQTHSLYSPMRQFANHQQAVAAAQEFLADLQVERELTEEERVDEDLLGKVLREEDLEDFEVNLDDFDEVQPVQPGMTAALGRQETSVKVSEISRRDLLRGRFRGQQ